MKKEDKKIIIAGVVIGIILIVNLVFLTGLLNRTNALLKYEDYYFNKNENFNHEARKQVCENYGLTYLESIQKYSELVTCCSLSDEEGTMHLQFCEDILA